MRKPTPNDLLQQLMGCEEMLTRANIPAKRKTELQTLEARRTGETPEMMDEFKNLRAILPELIASVRQRKNLERAAYYVGLASGIFIGLAADTETLGDDNPGKISIATAERLQSNKSSSYH
jgi:hypothetical protein